VQELVGKPIICSTAGWGGAYQVLSDTASEISSAAALTTAGGVLAGARPGQGELAVAVEKR